MKESRHEWMDMNEWTHSGSGWDGNWSRGLKWMNGWMNYILNLTLNGWIWMNERHEWIDENEWTNFTTSDNGSVIIDLGEVQALSGFTYTPIQSRWVSKVITHYSFYGSMNGDQWKPLASGEFSNIMANPIQQKIAFSEQSKVRFIKLQPEKISGNAKNAIIAEIGVITK